MPFVKIIKKTKGIAKKVGDIILIEDDEIRDGVSVDTDGNEYPTEILAPLTEAEKAECLQVEELQI